ncbi:hypothetical protein D3C72_1061060 [compost metagenome]
MGTISTPAGRLFCSVASLALTASMVSSAFLPERITMMPAATSPWPSSSAMPRRISGPSWMTATSPSRTGMPASLVTSGICRKSSSVFRYPLARTMYSASPSSSTEPPVSWLAPLSAASTLACDRL